SIPAASPASSAAKSEREFQLAREAAAQRSAVSVADADEASESGAGELRRVAGYTLSRRPDGTWVDVNSTPALPRVHVRAYSAAWFEIVNLLPELAPVLAFSELIEVVAGGVLVQVSPAGAESLTADA